MKHANFISKLICLIFVLGALWQYQQIAAQRNAIVLAHEKQEAEIEAYNAKILEEQERPYKDGTYTGKGIGFGGDIEVSIKIEEGKISSIDVISAKDEDPAYYEQAVSLLSDIIKEQSCEVDTVSGATYSSTGLIEACQNALEKAVK